MLVQQSNDLRIRYNQNLHLAWIISWIKKRNTRNKFVENIYCKKKIFARKTFKKKIQISSRHTHTPTTSTIKTLSNKTNNALHKSAHCRSDLCPGIDDKLIRQSYGLLPMLSSISGLTGWLLLFLLSTSWYLVQYIMIHEMTRVTCSWKSLTVKIN